jgi:hypothetical protein
MFISPQNKMLRAVFAFFGKLAAALSIALSACGKVVFFLN